MQILSYMNFTFSFYLLRRDALFQWIIAGADPGFQVRGTHLKKNMPSGVMREICCGISCEKSGFYAKKSYFFQFQGGARRVLSPPPPPPLDSPLHCYKLQIHSISLYLNFIFHFVFETTRWRSIKYPYYKLQSLLVT